MYVFGYGSLMNSDSLAKTIVRRLGADEMMPVRLNGFRRLWNLKETVYSEGLAKSIVAIFLNIEKCRGRCVNGVIFKVSETELSDLSKRERNYDRFDVADMVEPYVKSSLIESPVYTFVASNPIMIQSSNEAGCYVMSTYVNLVEDGCKRIGSYFYQDYIESTEPISFETLEGGYSFSKRAH